MKADKNEPRNPRRFSPSRRGFPGARAAAAAGVSREEGEEGRGGRRGKNEQLQSNEACLSALVSNAGRQSNSAWCLSSFSRLVPAWDAGKWPSDCPLCLSSQRGPSQPQFPKERDLGRRCLFFSEKNMR